MTKNQNKPFFYATLLMGLLLFPFLSFSQQEEPKRITIVVTAKEIIPVKQVVQLPADNLPKAISRPHTTTDLSNTSVVPTKKYTDPISANTTNVKTDVKTPNLIKNTAKQPSSALTPAIIAPSRNKKHEIAKSNEIKNEVSISSKKIASVKNTPAKEKIIVKPQTVVKNSAKETVKQPSTPSVTKPIVASKPIKEPMMASRPVEATKTTETKPKAQETTSNVSKKEQDVIAANTNKAATEADRKMAGAAKVDNNTTAMTKSAQSNQANAFSYLWIGAFLVIAGLALGLLFGKPAFLISFVGVVFIVLGIVL